MRDAAFDRARDAFILLYAADRDLGRLKSEEDYRRLFPGCEEAIAAEIRRLEALYAARSGTKPATRERPAAPAPWVLDRYRIERELGSGMQGTVFLATDLLLGRAVALKVLKASWSGSTEMVRRFEREARALARIDHPGIAAVHDVGSRQGLEYLVMPYVEGRTLAQEMADRPARLPSRAEALRYVALIEKAARSLHVAHEAGLVHRDVKPANIIVTPEDEPVVLDFGTVLLRGAEADALTRTGDVIGTASFMAPEQIAGDHDRIDRRTDVFALSSVLLRLVGEGGERGRLPRPLAAVLDAGTDPDPDRRYATAAAFADDLARVRNGLPVAVRPPSPLRKIADFARRAPAAAALVVLVPLAIAAGLVGIALKNSAIRDAAREEETRHADADRAARLATLRFKEYQRLNDLRRVEDLLRREQSLWPAHPGLAQSMERWLADADEVLVRLPEHRAALATLRERGRAEIVREAGHDPVMDRLLLTERVKAAAAAELRAPTVAAARSPYLTRVLDEAQRRIPSLEAAVASRPSHRYAAPEDQWLDDNLADLVSRLGALDAPTPHGCTRTAVRRRLEAARSLARVTLDEPASAWREAIAAIAKTGPGSPYGGLAITPVLGLVPIGPDPVSGLWEFAHVSSGVPPVRDATGKLVVTEHTAIVLVLVPGGKTRVGARPPVDDEEAPHDHVDPAAGPEEAPVHEVDLAPFFISKYEMTQGQWVRATGSNPSHHRSDRDWEHGYRPNLAHPVERVSWNDFETTLWRLGLTIPTEAQWEYAARGGTTTPWWPGASIDAFLTTENLSDSTLIAVEGVAIPHDAERKDGWTGTAPVGSYPPNPFGLHDVIGNVQEWCRDRSALYRTPALPNDGLRADGLDSGRAVRGGGFQLPASSSRSSARIGRDPAARVGTTGVRPALAVPVP